MIGDQRPRGTLGLGIRQCVAEPGQKVIPVPIVEKDLPALDSPENDLLQRTRGVYSGFSWHGV
jgi:hypothetical protein